MTDADTALIEAKAIEYAHWLAKRDGILLANTCKAEPVWGNAERVQSVTFSTLLTTVTINVPNWDWEPRKEAA